MKSDMLLRLVCLGIVAVALVGAAARWYRTPESHPDHHARGDMMRLIAVVLAGQVVELARSRFLFNTPGFWITTALLLPFLVLTLVLLWRLFGTYRQSRVEEPASPTPATPADRTHLP